jgi:predicted  nucleic acid-binding Zn-ribbon protein
MTLEALTKEVADLKRRLDLAETKLAQHTGQFEYISGQLRDVQLYIHARFDDVDRKLAEHDGRFDKLESHFHKLDGHFDKLETKVDALPRVIAEMIAKR